LFIFTILIACAMAYAITRGGSRAKQKVKDYYHSRVDGWREDQAHIRNAVADGKRPSGAPTGRKVAAGVATGVAATVLVTRGFVEGFRAGWPEGRQRGWDWVNRNKRGEGFDRISAPAAVPAGDHKAVSEDHTGGCRIIVAHGSGEYVRCGKPIVNKLDEFCENHERAVNNGCTENVSPIDGTYTPCGRARAKDGLFTCPAHTPGLAGNGCDFLVIARPGEPLERCDKARVIDSRFCHEHINKASASDEPAGGETEEPQRHLSAVPDTTSEEEDMPIETVTGGEVYTLDQLVAELQAIQVEATAELEDAQGDRARAAAELDDAQRDAKRAQDEISHGDNVIAQMQDKELDNDSLGELASLQGTNTARVDLAKRRVNLADQRLALAARRVEAADRRVTSTSAAISGVQRHLRVHEARSAVQGGGAKTDFYDE
jgi:hypothetical protein